VIVETPPPDAPMRRSNTVRRHRQRTILGLGEMARLI
jgi:hypothetical protein